MKRFVICLFCVAALLSLAACGSASETTSDTTQGILEEKMTVFYDDRIPLSGSPAAQEVVVSDQVCSSKDVGNGRPETEVIRYDGESGNLIAVGIGTAKVSAPGYEYDITVEPAPISLVMVIGHSIGFGEGGDPAKSVLIPEGQAYSSHGKNSLNGVPKSTGLGAGARDNPVGIHNFSVPGTGTKGVDSGLAYQWNAMTGEKMWVLNAGVQGSNLTEWQPDAQYFQNSVNLFAQAQKLLTREISSGHYVLKDMALVYFSAANFTNKVLNKNVQFTQADLKQWYDAMWNGYREKLLMDMDGDGQGETVTALGLVPAWGTRSYMDLYRTDKPANFYMSASAEYPDFFIASDAHRSWITEEQIATNFPKINYPCHDEELLQPTDISTVYSDGLHYSQAGYNALGLEIGRNLYSFLRQPEEPYYAELRDGNGNPIVNGTQLEVGKEYLYSLCAMPAQTGGLTLEVSDNLTLSYPCQITPNAPGEGVIKVLLGDQVLNEISFEIII